MIRQDLKTDLLPQIANRRSVRDFLDRAVEDEKLEAVLEAGRLAPSAKNRQPWRFILITDPVALERIGNAAFGQEHVSRAPAVIALGTTNVDYRMPNGQLSYPVDLSFAAAFMMIQAEAEGLGSCIVTTFDEVEVKEILTVPYSMRIVMLLSLGYPADEWSGLRDRKDADSIISRNHW